MCQSTEASGEGRKVICIEDLSVYYDETLALNNVSLSVGAGDYIGVIGPNGGGKTTLVKSILGLVQPTSGTIEIFGKSPGEVGRLIGYVPQVTNLDKKFPITVYEALLTGRLKSKLSMFQKYRTVDIEKVDLILEQVGILKLKNRMISELSGGEFQKMLIGRALAIEPELLILDEPTASVDAHSRDNIFNLLYELNKKITIVLVTHDLLAVSTYVKSLACINESLVYHGDAEINENIVNSLYGCPIELIAHGVPHRVLKSHTGEK